eukprot:750466-Hanusia_phi.AAC.1
MWAPRDQEATSSVTFREGVGPSLTNSDTSHVPLPVTGRRPGRLAGETETEVLESSFRVEA